jgi:hypothetical protein
MQPSEEKQDYTFRKLNIRWEIWDERINESLAIARNSDLETY